MAEISRAQIWQWIRQHSTARPTMASRLRSSGTRGA
ncbi:MAG: hypothetical protein R2855_18025 [Thermomicrobiales bacterium]